MEHKRVYGCEKCDEATMGYTPWREYGNEECEDLDGDPICCPNCGSEDVYVIV